MSVRPGSIRLDPTAAKSRAVPPRTRVADDVAIDDVAGGGHQAHLQQVLRNAPVPHFEQQATTKRKAMNFCASSLGIALFAGIIFFILLMFLRPQYVYKRDRKTNSKSLRDLNYLTILIISAIGAFLVFVIPWIISKTSAK